MNIAVLAHLSAIGRGTAASHRCSEDLRSWLAYRKAHDQIFEAAIPPRKTIQWGMYGPAA